MKVTQADMESRQRMANLQAALSVTMDSRNLDGLTYAEVMVVLSEMSARWARHLRQEDIKEGDR